MTRKSPSIYPMADLYVARYLLICDLRLLSSRDEQRALQKRRGSDNATYALFWHWENHSKIGFESLSRVLTAREKEAFQGFDRSLRRIAAGLPSPPPPLDQFQAMPEWTELGQDAREALASMEAYDMPALPDGVERRRAWQVRHAAYLREVEPTRCPCCCYRTRGERGDYSVCPTCSWEDDAQDEDDAKEVWGGPNGSASLAQAREDFIRFGASLLRRVAFVRDAEPGEA